MIAWAAFLLALLELLLLVGVAVMAGRLWRQARPTVEPLLAMFAPPPASSSSSSSAENAATPATTSPPRTSFNK